MLVIYRILINFIFLISPLILIFRLIKKKEDILRFKEKYCFFSKTKKNGKLIWFHGASVGELLSVVPLLEKLEKKKDVTQILVTSNTLSSSNIISKIKSKKIVHQFFPIDTKFLINKFLEYWKPSLVFFIDSEIWPNTIDQTYSKKIPIILINGRITKKSFNKWKILNSFAKDNFSKFKLCLASNLKSKNRLKSLGAKNVKYFGNLKFSQSENEKTEISKSLLKQLNQRKVWCASSTHNSEEKFCGIIHQKLKIKYKNLLTIIIPRHIDRSKKIENELNSMNLKIQKFHDNDPIKKDTDIFIINAFGKTKSFYNICKNIFLGGSLIDHGGQNPIEAARYGCTILHGKSVFNFDEIFTFLKRNNISFEIGSIPRTVKLLDNFLKKQNKSKNNKIRKKIYLIGKQILDKTYREISIYMNKS